MIKENLVKKLWKKTLPYFLTSSLAIGTFSIILPTPKCPLTELIKPPVAVLRANPTKGDAPLEVELDGSQSHVGSKIPNCFITKYKWDVDGDGETDLTTSEPFAKHIYKKAGKFDASLIVLDNVGQESDKALERIVVSEKEEISILGRTAFLSDCEEKNADIYSADIVVQNGNTELRNIERLTKDKGQDLEPTWSPDGKEILFTSHRTEGTAVWRMNADGTNQRDITSYLVERARQADWGNNGKIVVAYRDQYKGISDMLAGIGIIDPDIMGPDVNTFTPIFTESISGHIPGWPKWSPDCSKIVFQKYINGNWEIFSMNADGTDLKNLTQHPAIDNQPAFLSDKRLIFWSNRSKPKNQAPIEADLHAINLDGTNVTRLTFASGGELDPAVSPDGRYILFTGPSFQLYLTKLNDIRDMNKWIQLTTKGNSRYPAWKPKIENQN